MTDMIAIITIVLVVGGAVAYIVKAKRSGRKCIGCPHGNACTTQGKGCCDASCSCEKDK